MTITALDLMNVRPVKAAAEMIQERQISAATIPSAVLAGLRSIASSAVRTEVTVLIPRDAELKIAERAPGSESGAGDAPRSASPSNLANIGGQDAAEAATPRQASGASEQAPAQPFQLASLGPDVLPSDAQKPSLATPLTALPAVLAVLPPPAPGVPPPSPIERLRLQGKALARAERCLANAIYFEARDQPFRGQVAVAQVVMNRVFSGFYPEDVCGVIYQNADHHLACQFTFACDGKRKTIGERGAWARANRIARDTLAGKLYEPAVGTATHYHAFYVHPNWVREMRKLVRYGEHSFYRPIAWGNGADEPIWSKLALKKKKEAR